MGNLSLTKEARIYNEEKTVTSKNSAGKTGQLHLKSEIRSFFNTIHKNKLKMDERLKCETGHYKTFRGKYRQNILS